jgi:phage repressor protein C with HTH and peptisase S24 domain
MLTHADIWRAIDALAASRGLSASGLARRAGLDATSFNPSKRIAFNGKPRWPSTESLAKTLAATDCTLTEFVGLLGSDDGAPRRIPMLGYAKAGNTGHFDANGRPAGDDWEDIELPSAVSENTDPDLYALRITGDSMNPTYRKGDILIVSPRSQVRRGDRVVVRTSDGDVLAKELVYRGPSRVELASLNADHPPLRLASSQVLSLSRILWVSQ